MRTRSAWIMYGLVLVTGGLFAVVWLVLMVRDADAVAGRQGGSTALSIALLVGVAVHLTLLALIIFVPPAFPARKVMITTDIPLAVILFALELVIVVIINSRLRSVMTLPPQTANTLLFVFFTLTMFISLMLLQQRLNKLAARNELP